MKLKVTGSVSKVVVTGYPKIGERTELKDYISSLPNSITPYLYLYGADKDKRLGGGSGVKCCMEYYADLFGRKVGLHLWDYYIHPDGHTEGWGEWVTNPYIFVAFLDTPLGNGDVSILSDHAKPFSRPCEQALLVYHTGFCRIVWSGPHRAEPNSGWTCIAHIDNPRTCRYLCYPLLSAFGLRVSHNMKIKASANTLSQIPPWRIDYESGRQS